MCYHRGELKSKVSFNVRRDVAGAGTAAATQTWWIIKSQIYSDDSDENAFRSAEQWVIGDKLYIRGDLHEA